MAIIINKITGETIESKNIPSLVHTVKAWVHYNGLKHSDLIIHIASREVRQYLRGVVSDQQPTCCDICSTEVKNKDIVWHNDGYGVTIFGECTQCHNDYNPLDDDLLTDDDIELLEDIEEMEFTDEDIAEWQGRY